MKATTGLDTNSLTNSAASSSARAADLADHHDALGLSVLLEGLETVDEVGARQRVAADAEAGGLAETEAGELPDGLVGQGSGAGDHADGARVVECGPA